MSAALRVIAIDGPAGSGKSTTARGVARRLGWRYLDTGAMYRALALAALRAGVDLSDPEAVRPVVEAARLDYAPGREDVLRLDGEPVGEAIRTSAVGEGASLISVHPFVRRAMVALQRRLGEAEPSVLEGRDIGTVVFPDAGLKVFIDASLEERARRRWNDYRAGGRTMSLEEVRAELAERDRRDSTREDSPLLAAPDAVHLDTTGLTIEGQIEKVVELAKQRFGLEWER